MNILHWRFSIMKLDGLWARFTMLTQPIALRLSKRLCRLLKRRWRDAHSITFQSQSLRRLRTIYAHEMPSELERTLIGLQTWLFGWCFRWYLDDISDEGHAGRTLSDELAARTGSCQVWLKLDHPSWMWTLMWTRTRHNTLSDSELITGSINSSMIKFVSKHLGLWCSGSL